MPPKRQREVSPAPAIASEYAKSNIIQDRDSSFIAVFSPTTPAKILQGLPDFRSASHRVAGWRLPSKQATLTGSQRYDLGHDDDGESYAGKKLVAVLENQNVTGSVVVARWFGGTLLGPVRFKWIEKSAKEAIGRWKRGLRGNTGESFGSSQEQDNKRIKNTTAAAPEDKRSRTEIIADLEKRDDSINVLRNLLKDKKDKLEGTKSPASSPAKAADYYTMPMTRLQTLDKARDASIAYILKQLDQIDQQLKEEEDLDAAFEVAAKKENEVAQEKSSAAQKVEDARLDEEAFAIMEQQLEKESSTELHSESKT